MKRITMTLKLSGLALLGTAFLATAMGATNSWIHVRVDSEKGEKVRVNVPLALVSTVLPIVQEKGLANTKIRGNHIQLGDSELTISELRQIWRSIRENGSGELANVESDGNRVNVFLDGQYLRVESRKTSHERVHVKVPVNVVDALLSGTGDELDLMAAVSALATLGNQQLVEVQADDSTVKIWIDDKNDGQ